jgi:hypothetical protein
VPQSAPVVQALVAQVERAGPVTVWVQVIARRTPLE